MVGSRWFPASATGYPSHPVQEPIGNPPPEIIFYNSWERSEKDQSSIW